MMEFTIQWWLAALFGVAFGFIVAFVKGKYKASKDMEKCTNERLDKFERILKAILRKDINDIFNKCKSKKKIPDSEMEYAEAIYQEYKEYDPNGIMKTRMETMRAWATNEEKEQNG